MSERDGSATLTGKSYKEQVSSAIGWSVAGQIVGQPLQTAIGIVLARMLSPREFGFMGMIGVFTGFAVLLANMGFGAALVQVVKLEDRHLNSVFWINLLTGIVLSAALFLSSPYIAAFYHNPELGPLARACAPALLIQLTAVVPIAVRNRSMQLKSLVVKELATTILAGGLAITLAMRGFGAYSLVGQSLTAAAINSLLLWRTCAFRPSFALDVPAVRELLGFSSRLFAFQTINYWMRNADNFLIGKFVGPDALGAYTRAYAYMLMPITQVSQVVSRVMFPALSRVQDDIPRVKRLYLRTASAIALVTFPLMLGLMVVCDLFVLTVLGPRWTSVIPLLQVLAVVGLMQSIGSTTGLIYQSLGRTDLLLRWGIGSGCVTLAAFALGLPWGALGVAIAYALRNVLLVYWNYAIPGRLIGMRPREVLSAVAGTLASALATSVCVLGVRLLLPLTWAHWVRLSTCVLVGGACYVGLVWLTKPRGFADVCELMMNRFRALRRRRTQPAVARS